MVKVLKNNDYHFDIKTSISILLLVMVFGGIYGFIYETIFYLFDLGYFVKRGTITGPWIPIYAFGSLFILLLTRKFKKNPLVVFLLSCFICGLLEYITGYVLYHFFQTRLWDYNIEILNFGNIGGFICFRSVLFFGISGLCLMYLIIPFIEYLYRKYKNVMFYLGYILGCLFISDFLIINLIKIIKGFV